MPMKNALGFRDVVEILDDLVGGPTSHVGFHGAFWRGKTRDEFVATPPFQEVTPVVSGDSENSGIIQSLRGTGPFKPIAGLIGRMPPGGSYLSDAKIRAIAEWIDAGCPE